MANTANTFIRLFFESLSDFIVNAGSCFIRESLSDKMLRLGGFNPDTVYRGYKNMERRGLIKIGTETITLTANGRKWYKKSYLKYFKMKNRKWDKKWRLVIFDIPEELKIARNRFRNKLKAVGFYQLQKSVFVFPYPCGEELGDSCKEIGISDYTDVVTALDVGFKEEEIKTFFNL